MKGITQSTAKPRGGLRLFLNVNALLVYVFFDAPIVLLVVFSFSANRNVGTWGGVTLEWLRVEPGCSTGTHRIEDTQALFLVEGAWRIDVNTGPDRLHRDVAEGSVVSIPPGAWRDFVNVGTTPALCLVVCGGDSRSRITWDPAVVAEAAARGHVRDAAGVVMTRRPAAHRPRRVRTRPPWPPRPLLHDRPIGSADQRLRSAEAVQHPPTQEGNNP